MWRLGLAFLAAIGVGLLFALVQTVRRPVARLLRAMLTGLVAVLAIAGLAIGVTGVVEEAWWAAIIGGGMLLMALRFGWALRTPRRPRSGEDVRHVPLVEARPDAEWQRFEGTLDWVGRQQVRRAHKSIAGFLAERDSQSLTPEDRSLLLSCEKRVPELIQTCLDRCRNASPRERDRYIDETLARLEQLGAEAERARRAVREADDRRLQVLHRYFDGVAAPRDERQP